MPLSTSAVAAHADAPPELARVPAEAARPGAHGSAHVHPHGTPAPALTIRPSMLRLSLAGRLLIASGLLAVLWTAVALVVGAEP